LQSDAPNSIDLLNGRVKLAQLSKTAEGTFELQVKIQGRVGPWEQPLVQIVPPNQGSGASVRLQINGGAESCVDFGGAAGGKIANKGATSLQPPGLGGRSSLAGGTSVIVSPKIPGLSVPNVPPQVRSPMRSHVT